MDLSIIIVNYRSPGMIVDCLRSRTKFVSKISFEILVVDNFSEDNSRQIISDSFPGIRWIQLDYNSGFARANNEGIKSSTAEIILLLNPDVLFDDDSLGRCFQRFVNSDHVVCTPQLLNPDNTPQISGGYFIKGGLNNLLPLPVLGKIFKSLGNLLKVKKTSLKTAEGIREVDWINGAFMMIKKNVLERSGLMDEDFFLYAEEIEWCSRIRKYGKLCVYGDMHAIHLQGATANQTFDSSGKGYYNLSDKKGRQILVSNFLRIRKQFGVGWFLFHLLSYITEIPFFFLLALFSSVFNKRYSLTKFAGYVSNLFYLIGLSVKMIRNKPYFYKVI